MNSNKPIRSKQQQYQINNLAKSLSVLFGAEMYSKEEFDKLNQEKAKLLAELKDVEEIQMLGIKYYCYFLKFKEYHSKWKAITRKIEQRTNRLIGEKLLVQFDNVPNDIKSNLNEAYKTYIHGQEVSCYVMLLRTVEIMVNHIYDPHNENTNVPAKQKLDWLKKKRYLGGADYYVMKGFIEGRNEAVHTVFKPTQRQLFSAFETVINLIKNFLEQKQKG